MPDETTLRCSLSNQPFDPDHPDAVGIVIARFPDKNWRPVFPMLHCVVSSKDVFSATFARSTKTDQSFMICLRACLRNFDAVITKENGRVSLLSDVSLKEFVNQVLNRKLYLAGVKEPLALCLIQPEKAVRLIMSVLPEFLDLYKIEARQAHNYMRELASSSYQDLDLLFYPTLGTFLNSRSSVTLTLALDYAVRSLGLSLKPVRTGPFSSEITTGLKDLMKFESR